ncbi:isochorismate synthase [bacterium]|nr:MAG: isochorismate synthase [bacterium]
MTRNEQLLIQESALQELREFLDTHAITENTLVHVSIPFSVHDPLAILESGTENRFSFYWERPDLEMALSASGITYSIEDDTVSKDEIFKLVTHWRTSYKQFGFNDHSLSAPFFMGGMAFGQNELSEIWKPFKKLRLSIPEWTYIKNGQFALLNLAYMVKVGEPIIDIIPILEERISTLEKAINSLKDASPEPDRLHYYVSSETPFQQWEQGIKQAKVVFDSGEAQKLVLARELNVTANRKIEPTRFINKLRGLYPSCYSFMIHLPEGPTFLGSSPERLVSFHKNYILTEALAGSIPRGKSAKEDAFLEQSLFNSAKDLTEHQIVVSEIISRLKPFSNEIQVAEQPGIRKVANVQHLHTPITAWINHKTELLDLFFELHPTPAVGGYPKDVAKKHVQKIEGFDRGWYAGPVGWFNLSGSGEFAVGIRSGIIWENQARFYAGCGIVPDSEALKEWDETKVKFIPMLTALEFA